MLVAPFVRPTNVHIYVKSDDDARKLADKLDLIPVESNGNVRFAIARSNGVFYGSMAVNGINVVSNIQLYIDLLNYSARGEEAADELFKVIEKDWKEKRQMTE